MHDEITLTPANDGELRIEDVQLGRLLNFAQPRDIRKIIVRHAEPLNRFGALCATVAQTLGRPATVYFLNEHQALYICTKSETANAIEITIKLVEAFVAHRRGEQPVNADPRLSAAVKRMAKAVHSREETIWRKMLAIHGIVDPLTMTQTQVKLCLEWCELGGDYVHVGPDIWRQRCWPECAELHRLIRLAARRNDTSAVFWYKRLPLDNLTEAIDYIGPYAIGAEWHDRKEAEQRARAGALVAAAE